MKFFLFLILVLSLFSCNSEKKEKRKQINLPVEGVENPGKYGRGIEVHSPAEGTVVSSPLEIKGKAKGTWYFEAVFGVRLVDNQFNELAESYVSATQDWMTEDWVPFKGTLEFSTPESGSGFLIFEKANPSGLPKYSLSDTLQVKFRD